MSLKIKISQRNRPNNLQIIKFRIRYKDITKKIFSVFSSVIVMEIPVFTETASFLGTKDKSIFSLRNSNRFKEIKKILKND